jgi:hypothetical protein
LCEGQPDATRSAGDEGNLILEIGHRLLCRLTLIARRS